MSKEVEQRVVEMRFDNAQFERNASTTMSTLEKLKQRLNFTGASKGLENVGAAAKRVDMTSLATSVETVSSRFSSLEVMGITALANLTNSAVNAGKRIVSALTIDPVMTGFQEYETQMNAVQTILANTSSKGSTIDDVMSALNELNKYADQTIYNFTEMTRNIGTFTAAGVDLDKSVTSIKGIANLAAVSGSNAQQASTAMYQLSQALAAGRVSLMDWNSVVNAGMGGELFQNALKRTATQMGYNVDALIEKYGSFRESLTKGQWLTAEVLTETLTQLSGAYSEADLIAQGYSEKQAKEIVELANTAVGAATDIKTFTQLVDTMKESIQSGWAQTWTSVIGDFEQAKEFFSEFSELFIGDNGVITNMSNARNELLEGALNSNWDKLIKQVNAAGVETATFTSELEKTARATVKNYDEIIKKNGSLSKAFMSGDLSSNIVIKTLKRLAGITGTVSSGTEDMTNKLEYFSKVVNQVIRGDFGNGQARVEALTKAGYDHVAVQKLVNHIWERNGKTWDDTTLTTEELTKVIGDLSVAELENVGFTAEQANALKELAKQAEETGTPIAELIANLEKPSGRELFLDSIMNITKTLINLGGAISSAWNQIFPPMQSSQLYSLIEGFNRLTTSMVNNTEMVDQISRTFRGLFSILDLITSLVGGGFRIAWTVFDTVLGAFNLDVLEFTAILGDAAYNLRNFILENEYVTKAVQAAADAIVKGVNAIRGWIDAFLELPMIQTAIDNFKNGLIDLADIGKWAIEGLQNGFEEGLKSIPGILARLGTLILDTIKGVLGINSPSTEMFEIGEFTIQGLFNGLSAGVSKIIDLFKNMSAQIIEVVGSIPWGELIAISASLTVVYIATRLADAVDALTSPLEGFGDVLEGFGNVLDAKAFSMKADALKSLAVAIAILAGSLVVLSFIDPMALLKAGVAIAALAAVMGGLIVVLNKTGGALGSLKLSGFALALVGISTSILIMAGAMRMLDGLNPEKYTQTIASFGVIVLGMLTMMATAGKAMQGLDKSVSKLGSMMLKMSIALLLMVGVIKLVSGLSAEELIKGGAAITAFVTIIGLLSVISRIAGPAASGLGSAMIKLAVAMALMVGVVKLINGLSAEEIIKGGVAITAFTVVVGMLAVVSRMFGGAESAKLGGSLIAMSASMLLMASVIKILSGLSAGEIAKGLVAITIFGNVITAMVTVMKLAGKDVPKMAATLLAFSAAIGILAAVAVLLSLVNMAGLIKGVAVVAALGAVMAGLVYVTKFAKDVKGNLVVLAVVVGLLAASVAALSFVDGTKLAGATAALTILMGMFALMIKMSGTIKTSIGTLVTLSAVVALLTGAIYAISLLPIEKVLPTVASLSLLVVSLSAALKVLDSIRAVSPTAILAIGGMGLVAVALGALLGALEVLDIAPSMETVASISAFLLAMTGVTAILSVLGAGGVGSIGAAASGAASLVAVIGIIGALMVAIGGLVTLIPDLETFVSKAIPILGDVGAGIGAFVGGIVGGALAGLTSGLPAIGTNLSDFMDELQPFLTGASSIDQKVVSGVGAIAEMILVLTAANVVNGIASIFGMGASLADFGEELKPFGEAMAAFSSSVSGKIDGKAVEAAANAGLMLAEMASTIPKEGGIFSSLFGSADLETFGTQIKEFGKAIVGFSEEVSGKVTEESVEAALNAGTALSNLANNIPKQGGVLQDFLGTQDLETFGNQLKAFGQGIAGFVTEIGKVTIDGAVVTAATDAGLALAGIANNIPKQGGVLQDFLGTQDLSVFGTQIKAFGSAIAGFVTEIGKVAIDGATVQAATDAGLALAGLANNLPKQGGVLQNFFGTQDLTTFGNQLTSFGWSFRTYASYIEDVKPSVVTASANAAGALVALAESIPNDGFWDFGNVTLDEFGEQLADFGEYFGTYYNKISGINTTTLSGAITQLTRLVNLAKGMSGIDFGVMGSFGKNLTKLGEAGIEGFVSAFSNSTEQVQTAVNTMLTNFINTANAKKPEINSAFTSMMQSIIQTIQSNEPVIANSGGMLMINFINGFTARTTLISSAIARIMAQTLSIVRSYEISFRQAGGYLVEGFARGISENTFLAEAKARAMANAAYTAAMSALAAHSPSKLFMKVGSYVPLGFAKGIEAGEKDVEGSADSMAKTAIDSTKRTISMLADAINGDLDTQPTIRPVLDLSNVESGARNLNAMLSRDQAMSISSSMSRREAASYNQNGESTTGSGAVYQFTQNNYSPKALSRIDIYRQTKNQFSAFGRVVKA